MLKLKLQYFGHLVRRADSFEKTLMLGKIEGRRRRGRQRMRWLDGLDGHGFGWTPGVGDGQGSLACCDSWDRKEADTAEWLNWTELTLWKIKCLAQGQVAIRGRQTWTSIPLYKLSVIPLVLKSCSLNWDGRGFVVGVPWGALFPFILAQTCQWEKRKGLLHP